MAFVGAITQSGITQRRRDARLFGAVQRRVQEHRRNRRHGRLGRRDRRLKRGPDEPLSGRSAEATTATKKDKNRCAADVSGRLPMTLSRLLLILQVAIAGSSAAARDGGARVDPESAGGDAPSRRRQSRRQEPGQQPAPLYPQTRIAAVVNDEVISVADLASRVRMVMLSTAIPDTPEARQRLRGTGLAHARRREAGDCRRPSAGTSPRRPRRSTRRSPRSPSRTT